MLHAGFHVLVRERNYMRNDPGAATFRGAAAAIATAGIRVFPCR
jgi:hypothetical protein